MKKITCSYMRTAIALSVCLFLCSCVYQYYTGRYWIGKASESFASKQASYEDNERILETLRNLIPDFGFSEQEKLSEVPHMIFFGKSKTTKTKYGVLEGSNSAIAVTIITGRSPEILVQDLTNNYETEFMKEFKTQLEKRLNEVVDMKNVQFRREFDLMY